MCTFDTSIIIPPPAPAERQFNEERLQPSKDTAVVGEVIGAPRVISVLFLDHRQEAKHRLFDYPSIVCTYRKGNLIRCLFIHVEKHTKHWSWWCHSDISMEYYHR